MRLKVFVTGFFCFILPPCEFKNWLLSVFGWQMGSNCRVGFSWISTKRVRLANGARVGHANLIVADALFLANNAYIGHLNRVTGPLWLVLDEQAGVGNQNKIVRAQNGVSWGHAICRLGKWSKITVEHIVDCTRSVTIGDYSILAGRGSQLWTHGYLHAPQGLGRFRIDGSIRIGSNVYIGSACVFNAGVHVADAITIGASSCVARSLDVPGLYVSQPLRHIELNYEEAARRHPEVQVEGLVERVVNKHSSIKP
ncbi:acyltransferase [Stutzerimonas kirkiae]|uniref:acyltransferase n=1 Tax=Stutzerimonas kirkiae TaxID=2211392 RepID=UPI00103740A2|nr:hypothetical protein [Stutzerimonas kirkiae]